MIWSRRIFCKAIFCRYWTCSFPGRNNQAIGPRLSAIFTFLSSVFSYLPMSAFGGANVDNETHFSHLLDDTFYLSF